MAKDVSVEIGFTGGASTAVSVPEDKLEALTTALTGSSSGWHSMTGSDGSEFFVDLSNIVFVRIGSRSRSIGFSHA
jgi:hypothetical protein